MLRSVLSVLAGIVVLSVASFAIEAAVDPLLFRAFPQALPDPAALAGGAVYAHAVYAHKVRNRSTPQD